MHQQRPTTSPLKLVITGGGTGGHIYGGVAIAEEVLRQNQSRGFPSDHTHEQILFIGAEGGLETKLVPKAGYCLQTLRLGKLVGQTFLARLLTLFQIPLAIFRAVGILRRFRPHCVIGVGGYAAGPCLVAARILGIPTAVLEQNSIMGFTNRWGAKLSKKVFLAFDTIPGGFSKDTCLVTGNPTRSKLIDENRRDPSKPLVFIFGGSQGAHGINKLMVEASPFLKTTADGRSIEIIHQTGPHDILWVQKQYKEMQSQAQAHDFIYNMQEYYNKSHLIVCRAGSGTLAELAATGNTAILIPFPAAAGNHQEHNARAIAQSGAAEVVLQNHTTGKDLADKILSLLNDPEELKLRRNRMKALHRPNAAVDIVRELFHIANLTEKVEPSNKGLS